MTTEFVTAAAIVGLVGGIVGLLGGSLSIALNGWNLVDRINAARARAKQRKADADYDVRDSFY